MLKITISIVSYLPFLFAFLASVSILYNNLTAYRLMVKETELLPSQHEREEFHQKNIMLLYKLLFTPFIMAILLVAASLLKDLITSFQS